MGDQRGAMQRQLYAGISIMEQEGILDERFIMAYQLKEKSGPRYFLETIPQFCTNSEASIALMTDLMQLPILDYYTALHQDQGELIMGKMAKRYSILRAVINPRDVYRVSVVATFLSRVFFGLGSHKLAGASKDLRDACRAANRPQCGYVFENLKREYHNFKEKVTTILKLECRIVTLEGNSPQPAVTGTETSNA